MKGSLWGVLGVGFTPVVVWACPFCNVDGPVIRWFALFVVGPYLVGALFMLLWSLSSGHYDDAENPKYRMLVLDEETGVKPGTLTQGEG